MNRLLTYSVFLFFLRYRLVVEEKSVLRLQLASRRCGGCFSSLHLVLRSTAQLFLPASKGAQQFAGRANERSNSCKAAAAATTTTTTAQQQQSHGRHFSELFFVRKRSFVCPSKSLYWNTSLIGVFFFFFFFFPLLSLLLLLLLQPLL